MRTRAAPALLAAAVLLSCASVPGGQADRGDAVALVDRALAAQGGAAAVDGLRAISLRGTATFSEPGQSLVPGGPARPGGEGTFTDERDLAAGTARIEWVKRLVYPGPREYRYTELVTPAAGAVLGVDTSARTKRSQDATPPRHAMSGLRLAATQRELRRTSPRLLAEARANPAALSRVPDVEVGGVRHPAVDWRAGAVTFTLLFDPATGLPARIRTLDADNVHGDVPYDLVLSDWREVGGVRLPFSQRYELAGTEIVSIHLETASATAPAPGSLDLPAELLAAAAKPATGPIPYQWVLRRQLLCLYLDSDAVYYDPDASSGLKLVDLAPGVSHAVGGSHNSLVVELDDGLAVVDAPIDEGQAKWTIAAAKARYPGKPVRFLVASHHHMDHVGGFRAYAAEGATFVVGAGAAEHYRRALAAPDRLSGGTLAARPRKVEIREVAGRTVLGAGARTLEVFPLENPHAQAMVLPFVPHARIAFVADLWSPGRDKLGASLTPGQAAIVAAVRKAGVAPERVAGGHGGVEGYGALEALASK
jgi:glyoxylase-like metal-dependent hydrolase (beta-lactamase superfamily II)